MKNSGVSIFDNTRKGLKSNLVVIVVLVLKSKGLYFQISKLLVNRNHVQLRKVTKPGDLCVLQFLRFRCHFNRNLVCLLLIVGIAFTSYESAKW